VGLAAVSLTGKVLWSKVAAPYKSIQGYSASPVFYKSAVLMPIEGSLGCRMVALHRATGEVVWRVPLRTVKESYATPLVARVAGRDQVLLIGGESTRGYDPENGSLLWECEGPSTFCDATPVVSGDLMYATAGWPKRALLAIRANGKGNVTKSHIVWSSDAKAGYIPSPVLLEGLLYAINDQGLLRCYDAADGHVLWEKDFKAPFYSSPLLAGGKLFIFDRKGKGYVMSAGRTVGPVITNELPAGLFATPVILENRMYLRTLGDFYCIGN
jgi:outer membrane protein assembly factor BamB